MMKIYSLALLILASSCSVNNSPLPLFHKEKASDAKPEEEKGPVKEEDQPDPTPVAYGLQSAVEGPGNVDFDFKKPTEITWISQSEVVFSQDNGRTLSYNFANASWTSPHTSAEIADYPVLYDFREAGIVGFSDTAWTFREKDKAIEQIKANLELKGQDLIGIEPGFLAYRSAEALSFYRLGEAQADFFTIKDAPKDLTQVIACPSTVDCLLVAFDGSKFHVLNKARNWLKHGAAMEMPEGEEIQKIGILIEGQISFTNIVVITKSGKLFARYNGPTNSDTKVTWEQVKDLSALYCQPCHKPGDDGYDKPETWTSLKTDIISRLSADPAAKTAMPKAGSQPAKDLSKADREKMIAWLKTQKETTRGGVGTGTGTKDGPISGKLKELAEAKCISCHPNAKVVSWWTEHKADANKRIGSGDMPRGSTLDAATKKAFVDALNSI